MRTRIGLWIAGVAATIAAAAIVIVEVAGTLGGLSTDDRKPVLLGPLDALQTGFRLLGNTSAVRKAWPADVRHSLPPSPELRPLVVGGVALALAIVVGAIWLVMNTRRQRQLAGHETGAEWARTGTGDLRRLYVRGAVTARVILGRHGRQLVAAEANASTLVVAPTQAGKSSGIIIPAILEWDGCMLVTSVKGDPLPDTHAARSAVGEVRVFDPMRVTGYPSAGWSPILASSSWSYARRVAATLLGVDMPSDDKSADQSFWRPSGAPYLAALLLAAHHGRATIGDVLAWVKAGDRDGVDDVEVALSNADDRGADRAMIEVDALWGMDPKFVSSVRATLATALDAWNEESVEQAISASATGITPEWLLDGRNTLYLVAPQADQHRLAGLFSAIIQTVVGEAFNRSSRIGGRAISPRLLMVLDEAANIAPLRNLDAIASTGAGQGVTTLTVLQDLSQAATAWGDKKAQTILANHRARMFGAGIADTVTLDYLGAVLGERVVRQRSVTKDRAELFSLGSRTESIERLPLLAPDQIRQMDEGEWILVYANLRPARISGRPWFKDRRLRALAEKTSAAPVAAPELATPSPAPALAIPAAAPELQTQPAGATAEPEPDPDDEMEPPADYPGAYDDGPDFDDEDDLDDLEDDEAATAAPERATE